MINSRQPKQETLRGIRLKKECWCFTSKVLPHKGQPSLLPCPVPRGDHWPTESALLKNQCSHALSTYTSFGRGGHIHHKNTITSLHDRLYWPLLDDEIWNFCQCCKTCPSLKIEIIEDHRFGGFAFLMVSPSIHPFSVTALPWSESSSDSGHFFAILDTS